MKDNLFEMLLNLFEKTLSQLKQSKMAALQPQTEDTEPESSIAKHGLLSELVRPAHTTSMRVFTYEEQMKLTKASYQFIMRMLTWDIIDKQVLELVLDQLFFSDSRFVTLEETKWTLRNALAEGLNPDQLAFLDLVLYQKEDEFTVH